MKPNTLYATSVRSTGLYAENAGLSPNFNHNKFGFNCGKPLLLNYLTIA